MSGQSNGENIVASGPIGTVEYAVRDDGSVPVKEWLESQDVALQASFGVLFERLANQGPLFPNKDQFKKFGGSVWEFKRGGHAGHRIFCFEHGRRWLLTNHYEKGGSKKEQDRAAKLAGAIGNEHVDRERKHLRISPDESGDDDDAEEPTDEHAGGAEGVASGAGDS